MLERFNALTTTPSVNDTPLLEEWEQLRVSELADKVLIGIVEEPDWCNDLHPDIAQETLAHIDDYMEDWFEEQRLIDDSGEPYSEGKDGKQIIQYFSTPPMYSIPEYVLFKQRAHQRLLQEMPAFVPEDPDAISTEKFVMFQPVRIVRGKHTGIKAYFIDYDTPKVVFVILNKDPLQRERVFRSSITAITCSFAGCDTHAIAPLTTYPYKFDTPLCKGHQL